MKRKDYSQFGEVPQVLKHFFPNKRNGFFFEAGALDGEWGSNTLQVEKERNWTGILVEASPLNAKNLREKNRKAWTLEACLKETRGLVRKRYEGGCAGGLVDFGGSPQTFHDWFLKSLQKHYAAVNCVSISDILDALNVTHIDWLTLDIQGPEISILKSFPWDRVTVDIVEVERHDWHPNYQKLKFLEEQGYTFQFRHKHDCIYKRNKMIIE